MSDQYKLIQSTTGELHDCARAGSRWRPLSPVWTGRQSTWYRAGPAGSSSVSGCCGESLRPTKVVIPAAGRGRRLRPLTDDIPKALVDVNNRPLLGHVLDNLMELAVDQFVVVVGYRKEQIIDTFGESCRGVPITYVHQTEPHGLAHALLQAERAIESDFLMMLGDNIFGADLQPGLDTHHECDAAATVLVDQVPLEEASRYGVCPLDESGAIVELVEKPDEPPSNVVMTGFYALSPAIFHACHLIQPSDRGEYELPDALDLLIQSGRRIEAVPIDGWRVDVGYVEDRDRAERLLASGALARR